jgi:hypothetical protein
VPKPVLLALAILGGTGWTLTRQLVSYTNAIIFCTALTSVIGYDLKRKYD